MLRAALRSAPSWSWPTFLVRFTKPHSGLVHLKIFPCRARLRSLGVAAIHVGLHLRQRLRIDRELLEQGVHGADELALAGRLRVIRVLRLTLGLVRLEAARLAYVLPVDHAVIELPTFLRIGKRELVRILEAKLEIRLELLLALPGALFPPTYSHGCAAPKLLI
jgi:hypothetical protein